MDTHGNLVISRLEDESILIGDYIRVTVLKTGKRVRLRISAPANVKILREELKPCEEVLSPK